MKRIYAWINVVVALNNGCHAFVVVTPQQQVSLLSLRAKSQGWDNENFLEALSRGRDALDAANQEYYAQSKYRPDEVERAKEGESSPSSSSSPSAAPGQQATLTDEMKRKMAASHEEGQGGTRLKQIMQLAETVGPRRPPPSLSQPPQYVPPPLYVPPPVPPQEPAFNPNEMSVEDQARMFREMMMRQSAPTAQPPNYGMPPPDYSNPYNNNPSLPQSSRQRADRPVGRNRDADAISNTSDLYLAQLKLDSAVRNMARQRGDANKANAVFADESVHKLKDEMITNPYLTGPRQSMVGTSVDELLYAQMTQDDENMAKKPVDVSSSGVSYKEKLRQKRGLDGAKKASAPAEPTTTAPSTTTSQATSAATVEQPPTVPSQPTPAAPVAQSPSASNVAQQQSPPPAVTVSSTVQVPQTATSPVVSTASSPTPVASIPLAPATSASSSSSTSSSSNDDPVRNNLRALMGLLLKHRGGPGFGSGRLKGPEMARFQDLLGEVTSALQMETGSASPTAEPTRPESSVAPPQVQQSIPPPPPPPPVQQAMAPPQPQQVQQAPSVPQSVVSSAIAMTPSVPAGERINRMISCIEGALQMYKNSPPELQEGLLVTMRSALMSAVTTCNQVIAENELRNFQAYQALSSQAARPVATTATPTQFYDVVQVNEEEDEQVDEFVVEEQYITQMAQTTSAAPISLDENSQVLQQIYYDLKAAAGNGKLGLRSDLTANEASNLSNQLMDLRVVLMDELEHGIPSNQS